MGKVCCSQLKGADKGFNKHVFFSAGEMKYSTGAAYKVRSDGDCLGMSYHGNNTTGGIH